MKTNDLIDSLSQNVSPVSPGAWRMRLATGIGGGALVSAIAMLMWLGVRPDLSQAMMTSGYWIKFAFTALLTLFAFWATGRLARPGAQTEFALAGVGAVFLVLLAIASMQLMKTPMGERMPLIMGHSAKVCPWRIAALSLPIFVGVFWSLKALAPTRLILTGFVAGLASGALGAWIYAFHCDESAAAFVFVFYTFGIALIAAAGAAIARPLLRW